MNEQTIPEPQPNLFISDLESLKVIADPLRNQIMEILSPAPRSINQVADRLGLQASKLYYHFNLLEKHGFLRVVDSAVKGNLIEKVYWLTAYNWEPDHDLFDFSTPGGQETTITSMASVIETTREDLVRSLQARAFQLEQGAEEHPRKVLIFRELANLSDEQANEFLVRLRKLEEAFDLLKKGPPVENTHTRALTIAYYPSFYYDEGETPPE